MQVIWKNINNYINKYPKISLIISLLFLFCVPYISVVNDYILHIFIMIMLYIILALGLNIVVGFTGLLDLGYVGFYGIGAYTTGLLTVKFIGADSFSFLGNFWLLIILSIIHGALWGILLGAPTLRLRGDYFAIVTFGFSELVILIITNEVWLTNGPRGVPGILPPMIGNYMFISKTPFYYLIFILLIIVVYLVSRFQKSYLGRAWFAIREDEIAAESMGINIMKYKIYAFALSASIASLGGAFYARWMTFIGPKMFQFWESVIILCMVVLGGMGSIYGVIAGAFVLTSLGEILREILFRLGLPAESRYLFFGIVMIVIMRYRPEGIWPTQGVKGEMHPDSIKNLEHEEESYFDERDTGAKNKWE
ncbi:MAG: branched-chain amino acid ABC transporter permease [Candidatus Firestonebacteria bacterium]|nr:branched-chain amino acid ABC transporter permease [Candidatus Firestonebacteria bacterium]